MKKFRFIFVQLAIVFCLILAGCHSIPLSSGVNPKTGLYDTETKVDPGGVLTGYSRPSLNEFSAILVVLDNNQYSERIEYLTRKAFADLGFLRVINISEFKAWAKDSNFDIQDDQPYGKIIKDFSISKKPILIAKIRFAPSTYDSVFSINLIDGRSLESIVSINHVKKFISHDIGDEMVTPVFNELRLWCKTNQNPSI